LLKDLRHGARMLLHARGWTAVVVLSLAVGIGANTALFSAVNGMLIETLPVSRPEQLVRLRYAGPNDMVTSSSDYGFSGKDAAGLDTRTTFSYPMYQQFVADNQTMTDLFAFAPIGSVNIVVDGAADIGRAFLASGPYYRALGVRAAIGRTLGPDDDRADAPPAAVLSHKYWHSRFAGDPAALGKIVRVNNVPVTIVRPFNTFGPRQSARAVIPTIIGQCFAGTKVQLGALAPTRDFTFVADTVSGFLAAAEAPATIGETINLGVGEEISIGDLAKLIAQLIGKTVSIEQQDNRLRPPGSEVERLCSDNSKARRLVKWEPKTGLREGLLQTIEWFKDHGHLIRTTGYAI